MIYSIDCNSRTHSLGLINTSNFGTVTVVPTRHQFGFVSLAALFEIELGTFRHISLGEDKISPRVDQWLK